MNCSTEMLESCEAVQLLWLLDGADVACEAESAGSTCTFLARFVIGDKPSICETDDCENDGSAASEEALWYKSIFWPCWNCWSNAAASWKNNW